MTFYPVYQPRIGDKEKEYVNRALDSGWISSRGEFVSRFEDEFAAFTGAAHAATVSNGTVALHLALEALNLPKGSEVIVPSFTYIASVNMIELAGLKPVFADSLEGTWQVDPADVAKKITSNTSAVMIVHLYGHPCDMDAIQAICRDNDIKLVEDCAEAFGALWKGRHVGTFGDASTFSFFGNKTLTCGEGGMLTFEDEAIYKRAVHLKGQAMSLEKQYWHDELGYNYRMTNIAAAIGCAQLEGAVDVIAEKRQLAAWYREALDLDQVGFHEEIGDVKHSYWMVSILLPASIDREALIETMRARGVDTRPAFYPAHVMPMYQDRKDHLPVAEMLGAQGLNLPSYPDLKKDDVAKIVSVLHDAIAEQSVAT